MSEHDQSYLRKLRWRLVLGQPAHECMGGLSDDLWKRREQAVRFLYERGEAGKKSRNTRAADKSGGLEDSCLSVPAWINEVHELFPERVIERIEQDALEKYQLKELLTDPGVLQRAQPSQGLLKAVLSTKHLMNQDVLAAAKDLVRKVVQEMMEKLMQEVRAPFFGARLRRRSFVKIAKNFDTRDTIKRNLKHYKTEEKRIYIETPIFISRVRRQNERYQLIILVDESGSMMDSVVHSSIMASIFWGIKSLRTHLLIFDVNVVDLTADCSDPVETLMKVQLGGGTDIGNAVRHAASLVDNPKQTIIILVSDFYEGAPPHSLKSEVKRLVESGVTMLGLAALDRHCRPVYNHELAAELAALGMKVAAMTPGELANWVAEKIN